MSQVPQEIGARPDAIRADRLREAERPTASPQGAPS